MDGSTKELEASRESPRLNWRPVLGILALEFFERMAYYSSVFTFTPFSVTMMGYSVGEGNALLQGFWALTPLSAFCGAFLADTRWSRRTTITAFGTVYIVALALCAASASPFSAMFRQFPEGVTVLSEVMFAISIVLLAIGYGGMKSSCAALLADSAWCDSPVSSETRERLSAVAAVDDAAGATAAASAAAINSTEDQLPSDMSDVERSQLSSLFRWYYWAFNCGALVGTLGSPFLLLVDPRTISSRANGNQVTGYYVVYWASATVTVIGLLAFLSQLPRYAQSGATANIRFFFRAVCKAVKSASCQSHTETESAIADVTSYGAFADDCGRRADAEVQCVGRVLVIFSVLPIYWLVANQYGSNLVLQASWLALPPYFQPELFANVNTFSTLLFLPIFDRVLRSRRAKRPLATSRMVVGFGACIVGLLWCGGLQVAIQQCGYVDDDANYTLYQGQQMLSAAWLLPPYVFQGIASALVDTAAIETGYLLAPASMKSSVHALYLLGSSASGFLGMALAPAMLPRNFALIFFSLALALALATAVFFAKARRVEHAAFSSNIVVAETPKESRQK